jgi:hypothetical protein
LATDDDDFFVTDFDEDPFESRLSLSDLFSSDPESSSSEKCFFLSFSFFFFFD